MFQFQFPVADHCLSWSVAPIPQDLQRRHVEITGPTDRKMVINALNSGSDMFMADFEDSLSPTWKNSIDGQINMLAANKRTIEFKNPDGKHEFLYTIVFLKILLIMLHRELCGVLKILCQSVQTTIST